MGLRELRKRFEADTAYDRLMLGTIVGPDLLLRQLPSSAIDDLRGSSRRFVRTAGDSVAEDSRNALLDDLRPLLFASSWKVLDLMIELVRELDTGKRPPSRGWRITDKVKFVQTKPRHLPDPFKSYPGFWRRLAKLYDRLEEPRNAVVHRRFKRSSSRGVIPYGIHRRPLRTISVTEIDALVVAAYALAEETHCRHTRSSALRRGRLETRRAAGDHEPSAD